MSEDRIIKTTTRGDGEVQVHTMTQSCCSPYITFLTWPNRRYDDWPMHLDCRSSFSEAEAMTAHAAMVADLDARLLALMTEAA
jgi:hypothetical protein